MIDLLNLKNKKVHLEVTKILKLVFEIYLKNFSEFTSSI